MIAPQSRQAGFKPVSIGKINELIDWEMFRAPIETAIRKDISKGGRPPYDAVLMFKITMFQQWYGLSDMALEYQVNDCVSSYRFLGLEFGGKVPDGTRFEISRKRLRICPRDALGVLKKARLRMLKTSSGKWTWTRAGQKRERRRFSDTMIT